MSINFDNVDWSQFDSDESPQEEETQQSPARVTVQTAMQDDPDKSAKLNQLSRDSGLDQSAIAGDPQSVERSVNFDSVDWGSMEKQSPKTTKFLGDYKNAAVMHDDISTLERMEKWAADVASMKRAFTGVGESIGIGFKEQLTGMALQQVESIPTTFEEIAEATAAKTPLGLVTGAVSKRFRDALGIDETVISEDLQRATESASTALMGQIELLGERREDLTPDDLSTVEQGIRAGVESLGNMAPGAALMLLSGGRAAPMLLTMGAQTYASSFGQGRVEGLTTDEANRFAMIDAAIEVGTEMLPTGTIERILTGSAKGMTKEAIKFMVQEMGTEQLATLGQTVNSFMFGLDEQLDNAQSLEEVAQIQLQRQAVTAIATVVAGGAQAGIATSIRKTADQFVNSERAIENQGELEQQRLDEIAEVTGGAKSKRDKETFKSFAQSIDDDTNVFMDGPEVVGYLSQFTEDKVNSDPVLSVLNEQVKDVLETGGDIVVNLPDFVTDFTGSEHFGVLHQHMTLSAETVSPARREAATAENERFLGAMMEQAQENTSQYVEAQDIYNNVREQLVDAGRMSAREAAITAELVPAYFTAKSVRTGTPVAELFAQHGFTVQGPETGRAAELEGRQQVLEQSTQEIERRLSEQKVPEVTDKKDRRVLDIGRKEDRRKGDRRKDADRRERIEQMSPEEQYRAIYGHELTGLNNRRAFEEDLQDAPTVVSIDVDSLKSVNDNLGHGAGDDLLKTAARALHQVFGGDAYHISGDEFYVLSNDSKGIEAKLEEARELLKGERVVSDKGEFVGPQFTYGIADSKEAADTAMEESKVEREESGERTPRGELPASLTLSKQPLAQSAFAGASVLFDRFSTDAIGTGEDTAAFGYGLYLAESRETAEKYQVLGGTEGFLYEVTVPDEVVGNMIDWDAPVKEQPEIMEKLGIDPDKLPVLPNRLRNDMSGQEIVDALSKGQTNLGVTSKKEASEFLNSKGIPGVKYKDPESAGETSNFVVFDDANIQIDSINGQPPKALFQDGKQSRGYYDPENSMIRLTEASDLSTFIHEFAHFMYETERGAVGELIEPVNSWFIENADAIAKDAEGDVQTSISADEVAAYVRTGSTGNQIHDMAVERATHEQFARGFEKYIMEGKSPSTELRNTFRIMANWLVQIYHAVKGELNVSLNNDIRQVFDRLVATEDQIEAAAARAKFEPLFTDAAVAGMTEGQFKAYQDKQKGQKDKAKETLREKLIKQITRNTKQWWNDELDQVQEQQRELLGNTRLYSVIDELKNGEFKLDRFSTKVMVGTTQTDKRGRESLRIPAKLNGMHVTGGEGFHPDIIAPMFGYESGAEMLDDVINAPTLNRAAELAARRIMVERHGDILNDGSIEREADEALRNEEHGDLLLQELKALNRQAGRRQADKREIQNLAKEKVNGLSFRRIHPNKYKKAEVEAAREAGAAFAKGDTVAAADAKTREVMNFYLFREATEARQEILKIQEGMSRYNKKSVREAIQKAGNGYWGQIVKVLSRFEFRKSATLKSVDQTNQALNEWVRDRIEQDGDRVVLTPAVMDETYQTHWKNVSYGDLQGVHDSVKNLEHVARYSNKLDVLEEKLDFNEVVNRWTSHMDEVVEDTEVPAASRADRPNKVVQTVRGWMAETTKIPFLASWLDGGERVGMSHDLLIQNVDNSRREKFEMMKKVADPVGELLQKHMKENSERFARKYFIPEIKGTADHTGNLMLDEIISIALNTGNQGNLRKMLLGEGWATPEQENLITFENPRLQAVLSKMTANDWTVVQQVWDAIDQLREPLAETYNKSTGLDMDTVKPTPIKIGSLDLKGGYYPVKYDRNRSQRAEESEARREAETESMFSLGSGINVAVNAGAVNTRTDFYDPISLDLNNIANHIHEVIHYVTFHDTVRQLNKLIRNPEITRTIKAKVGAAEYNELLPWLNDVAKDGREQQTKLFWDKAFHRLRFGVTLGTLGFSASTNIVQILGLSTTAAEVGLPNVLRGVRKIVGSNEARAAAWDFAVERSNTMAHRIQNMDRDMKAAISQIKGEDTKLRALQEMSMKTIALIQTYAVDLPSWHAAYMKGMADWNDEGRASRYADWVVNNTQGSGLMENSARIMRDKSGFWSMFTQFMTFFSSQWNLQRDLIRGLRANNYSVTTVAAKLAFLYFIPVFAEMLIRGEFGDDDEETNAEKYFTSLALYPLTGLPVVRDMAGGFVTDFGYNLSPIGQLLESGISGAKSLMSDEDLSAYKAKNISKLVGAVFAVPGVNQVWRTGEHLYEVIEDGEELSLRESLFGPKRE